MEIETQNGKKYLSADCEPRGEAYENIGYDWLADKFRRITAPVLTKEGQEAIINLIESDENLSIRTLVDTINSKIEYKNGFKQTQRNKFSRPSFQIQA